MNDVAPVQHPVTQEQIDSYADASGDHNPIHVDTAFAAGTPFEGTIAHGMLVLAFLGEMLHASYGDAWLTSGSLKVRFKAPTRPGDIVTSSTAQTRIVDGRTEYSVQCANQRSEVVIEGRASVDVGS